MQFEQEATEETETGLSFPRIEADPINSPFSDALVGLQPTVLSPLVTCVLSVSSRSLLNRSGACPSSISSGLRHAPLMLTPQPPSATPSADGLRFTVVASQYNLRFVDGLLAGALETLRQASAPEPEVIRVPGSWEIPAVAGVVARRSRGRPDAILCFGLIWQGETLHAQHIGDAVSDALMALSMETGVPVIHQVLTVSSEEQAKARCLDPETHRGVEGARTAIAMARLMQNL